MFLKRSQTWILRAALNNGLKPIELTVKALCLEDAILVTAEKAIDFIIEKLEEQDDNI